ncbi:BnaC03g58410D [Brassica napus]|uniref:BnaC03g58410D protein n=1 Tax=Brassica napus TaxID=3708 RepID=A0A078HBD8_BRANA|nr:BnaC03g58410D [Brassica napus]
MDICPKTHRSMNFRRNIPTKSYYDPSVMLLNCFCSCSDCF